MKQLAPKYNPAEVEKGKYQVWLEKGYFEAGDKSKEPFCIVIPPPNVTGKLHLGHAWDGTLQDILIRYKRMQGYDALWLPGMDHAGIATQAKVDARLKEMGTDRYEVGREKFLEHAWDWKEEYASHIREQWATMGLALDYTRERFTLDEGLNDAVNEVFIRLYQKGLIYRGERIINWDPQAQTALSNIEVIHKEVEGAFYHFKYMIEGTNDFLEVATTRPETMFGDTAVAVHPDDERYTEIVGKNVLIPGSKKAIPVITDEYVEMDFGSGAVKITPAHDPNDFEVGNRHDLERPIVMNADGTMNEHALKYNGMDRFDCRRHLVADLEAEGLVIKIDTHVHNVGHSERTDVIVEPYLSKQWFVKMDELAKNSLDNQLTDGRINFVPERFSNTFNNWMEGVHDWCISRQLWWGHRIPAWYKGEEVYIGAECPGEGWTQDEDVLDTWFSSALWPFSTLGWPNQTEDLERFFPTDVLVTGYDIIFFWVSRMIFQSLEFTGQRPFKDVLMHGLIRASDGRKMSKSLGNGVDPIKVVEQYGADSLRFFLTTSSAPGQDLRFMEEKVESTWNFINKIWNASRFVLMNTEDFKFEDIKLENLNVADEWILTRLNETIEEVNTNMENYEFGVVGNSIYKFVWEEYCNWYIEVSKLPLNGEDEQAKQATKSVLVYVLTQIVKLLHPFMPFVTEEIYQALPTDRESITIATWPEVKGDLTNNDSVVAMDTLIDTIRSVRNIRAEVNAGLSKAIRIMIKPVNEEIKTLIEANENYIHKFCNPSELTISTDLSIDEECMSAITKNAEIYLPIEGLVDIQAEIDRLEVEEKKLKGEVKRGEGMLANEKFISKAPAAKVEAEREKLKSYKEQLEAVSTRLKELKNK